MLNWQHIKKQRHNFADKGVYSQSYGFSSNRVWMWELNHKESWALKNWCFWTVVLEMILERPLDCKEIQPVNPKGNQFWIFIGRTEAEAPILWPPNVKNWPTGKDPDNGKDWRQKEKGTTEDEMAGWRHQHDVHESERAPGVGDRERSLACCSRRGHKELDTLRDWTELNENENTTHLNLWNATKAVLRRKFTVLVSDFRKEARERTSET